MKLETKRLFLPNLPEDISEEDVREKFFKFGNVTSVEIKNRKELGPKNVSHVFAFINIDTDYESLNQCFGEFTNKKWKGQFIDVQLAKESFLERLKRERLEEQIQNQAEKQNILLEPTKSNNDTKFASLSNGFSKIKVKESISSSSDSSSEEDVKSPNKKAKIVAENSIATNRNIMNEEDSNKGETTNEDGPDYSEIVVKSNKFKKFNNKIQSVGNAPIIISSTERKNKSKDPFREQADQRRVKSLLQMKKGYHEQKSMIQSALSNIDSSRTKKIVFNDDGDPENANEKSKNTETTQNVENGTGKSAKVALFNDDEDSAEYDENNFKVKKQFQGKRGKELFDLQSRYKNDARFHLDERFIENDEDEDAVDNEDQENPADFDVNREARNQLDILGEVLGKKFESRTEKPRKSMLRFDPSVPEHSKYEIREETVPKKKSKKEQKAKEAAEEKEKEQLPEVSQETFFQVTDTLKDVFTTKTSFSLLGTFGRSGDNKKSEVDTNGGEDYAKIDKPKKKLKGKSANPFKYDSSDDEQEDGRKNHKTEVAGMEMVDGQGNETKRTNASQSVKLGPGRLWTESFFFLEDDYRLQEGLDFIRRLESEEEEGFKDTRRDLQRIVKKKFRDHKNKKQKFRKKLGGAARKTFKRGDRARR